MTATATRFTFGVKDAAAACQVNPRTITRRMVALQEHGAVKDEDGAWRIPPEALMAVGLNPGKPSSPDAVTDLSEPPTAKSVGHVTPDIELKLAELTHRAELAEALLAAERRMNETLHLALRALAPGEPAAEPDTPAESIPEPVRAAVTLEPIPNPAPAKRRRWWQLGG